MHPPSHSIGPRSCLLPRKEIRVMDCCAHEGRGSGDARFEIQKVADGVHVAVAAPAYKVNSNTAIIESDDGVVIVDTHSKPSAARVIVERLRDITTKPVRYVVNTHFHWDHWHGNEVYPAAYPHAEIVTNQLTRDAVIGWTPFMGDGYPEDWTATLDRLAQLDFTTMIMGHGDVAGRNWLSTFRGYIHDMVGAVRDEAAAGATLEEVQQRVPAKLAPTYEKSFSVYGHYRPWRQGIMANIERAYAMVG